VAAPGAADPQRLAHRAAVAVRRDQVGGAQGVFVPVAPAQPRRDAICVLLEADQLGLEPDVGAELDRPFAKYRLEPVLGERGAPARRVLDLEDLRLLGRPGGLLEPLPGEALDADPTRTRRGRRRVPGGTCGMRLPNPTARKSAIVLSV